MDIKEIWQESAWNVIGQDVIQSWVIMDMAVSNFGFHGKQIIFLTPE
jgi:hypothetical protein